MLTSPKDGCNDMLKTSVTECWLPGALFYHCSVTGGFSRPLYDSSLKEISKLCTIVCMEEGCYSSVVAIIMNKGWLSFPTPILHHLSCMASISFMSTLGGNNDFSLIFSF